MKKDWVIKCSNCGYETTIGEIDFTSGCPKCGQGLFKVVKTPDGKDIKSK